MPACSPSAVPCNRLGKKYDVLGMNPEKAPPPMPARNASTMSSQYGAVGLSTRTPHPRMGKISSAVVAATILRVPMTGGSTIQMIRMKPAARPGMAAIQ